ncbi:hypothetical protein [Amycolatopsis sp. NPDC102389]|uniref:hypothetical protein n=1 Tax=Amycolatopsis sp. NPDC102389 TaxID=3363941 RepID=UPI003807E0C7
MADQKITGEHTKIEINDYNPDTIRTDKMLTSLPGPLGSGFSTFDTVKKATADGFQASDIGTIAASGAGFVSSCMGVADIASDPIGWLVGQGLSFLMNVCQPIQDAIHMVSGDGPALSNAAGNFNNIGVYLQNYSKKFEEDAKTSLSQWTGDAANAAGDKLAKFAHGIDGIAAQAGDIAQLLQISSMVMTVIEEFIKAILTEFITWLIMIWIPALAAAVPTCGGSTATAGGLTATRAVSTTSKVQKFLNKLRQLLDKIKQFLGKLKEFFGKWKGNYKELMAHNKSTAQLAAGPGASAWGKFASKDGAMGGRLADGFGERMTSATKKAGLNTVGLGKATNSDGSWKTPETGREKGEVAAGVAGKVGTYTSGGIKAGQYGSVGDDEQTTEESSDNLDF